MRKPYKYQEKAIKEGIESKATLIDAACGTGKSLMASQIAIGKGKPTIIITPKNIVSDFVDELKADGVDEKDIWVYSAEAKRKGGEAYFEAFMKWLMED